MDGGSILEVKVHANKFSWLKITGINCFYFGESCHFSVYHIVNFSWINFLGQCFGRIFRV